MKREVTRIVTPGTLTDDSLLNPAASNYLAAVALPSAKGAYRSGLAWVDVSTGRFHATTLPSEQLPDHLARIRPAELLVSDEAAKTVND